MKNVAIVLTISWLLRPGEMKEWPTHTICKTKDFEAYYKSCDPLQDIGVSFYPCSRVLTKHITAKIGVILKFVLYNHFVSFGFSTLPKGEYFIMLELLNEHAYKVACANFTLYSHSPV
ncbi:lymphocyte antigen 86 isoform X3 [Bufo gargarizans]|uniref:lymphocyte antigen 86 isoform X3 n=1 Tax=Bufo gargarizans TaxID=30331 RepID=UPI001CF38D48|nr:lymphocyte antigen 86 isoform X3 [Bufo gargarizans]